MEFLNNKLEIPSFKKEIHWQVEEKLGKLIVLKIFYSFQFKFKMLWEIKRYCFFNNTIIIFM
jgi:hypothetical protein